MPIKARTCILSILMTLKRDGSTPGGAFGSALGMRSCNQSGTLAGSPSWSHLDFLRLLPASVVLSSLSFFSVCSAAGVDNVGGGEVPSGGCGVEH